MCDFSLTMKIVFDYIKTNQYTNTCICLDGKEFVAILSYVYSLDLKENTKNNTKKIVKCIQEKMEEMNYKFYDSHRDFDQGCKLSDVFSV